MALPVDWTDDDAKQLAAGTTRIGVIWRAFTHETHPIRLWSGAGDLVIPTDAADPFVSHANPYIGVGALAGIPVVNALMNGVAERADFTLSAVDMPPKLAELAADEAALVRRAPVQLGLVFFDAGWQLIASPVWLWRGLADSLKIQRTSGADGEVIRNLILSVASSFSGRRRPVNSYWTDPDQKMNHPTDDFFDRVAIYYQGSTMVWPQ